jgi:hypothetical protein
LEAAGIVDYSMMVALQRAGPDGRGRVRLGLIDYLQPYNLAKKFESTVKKIGGAITGKVPTVVETAAYRKRFCDFLIRSFEFDPSVRISDMQGSVKKADEATVLKRAQMPSVETEMTERHGQNLKTLGDRAEQWLLQSGDIGTSIVKRLRLDAGKNETLYYAWCLQAKSEFEVTNPDGRAEVANDTEYSNLSGPLEDQVSCADGLHCEDETCVKDSDNDSEPKVPAANAKKRESCTIG